MKLTKKKFFILKVLVLTMAFAFSACQKNTTENNNLLLPQTSPSVLPALDLNLTSAPNSESTGEKFDSSVRKIDFKNFSYPWTKELADNAETLTLKNGEFTFVESTDGLTLEKVEYGDITDDKKEEAIIDLRMHSDGTAVPNAVYIYALENEKPKLLWSFDTGDRAEGGLKKVYEENGELVVETFGDNKFENDKWEFSFPKDKFNGYCCPTAFTKVRFKWNGEKFAVEGKPELFDYDWKRRGDK